MPIALERLNAAAPDEFVRWLDAIYPGAPWIAKQASAQRPFASLAQLKRALVEVVRAAPPEAQRDLVASTVADVDHAEALRRLHRVAAQRLNELVGFVPQLGNQLLAWADELAQYSDPGYRERGELTVTFLTDAHRACAERLADWMRAECGFDRVEIDAVGSVVGIYDGANPHAPRLLTGSHYDTVRNGGRYDGRLGIFTPMLCVRELARRGRRLPFGIEVIAFAEEEGQRYRTGFLASSALVGAFDLNWLDQADADGITMRAALARAGLASEDIPRLRRESARYLGYVEVHIEQGPVLYELDLPLGVVTSINGSVRYEVEIIGVASHAGTTPMDRRRDAAAAAAELILFVERRAARVPHLVGTVGMLEVPSGSVNVVPGCCRLSLDIRAPADAVRDTAVDDVLAELAHICTRRGLRYELQQTMRVPAAPCAPDWQQRWARAVEALGLPVHRMASGAGHDAMKIAAILPQAMLFVRGLNSGISHNPQEAIAADDAELAVRAFQDLLEQVSAETS